MIGIAIGGLLQVLIAILRRTFDQRLENSKREQNKLENADAYQRRNALKLQRLLQNWSRLQALLEIEHASTYIDSAHSTPRNLDLGLRLQETQTEVYLRLSRVTDTELRTKIESSVEQVIKLHIARMQSSKSEYLTTRDSHFLELSKQLSQVMELIGTYVRENLEPKL